MFFKATFLFLQKCNALKPMPQQRNFFQAGQLSKHAIAATIFQTTIQPSQPNASKNLFQFIQLKQTQIRPKNTQFIIFNLVLQAKKDGTIINFILVLKILFQYQKNRQFIDQTRVNIQIQKAVIVGYEIQKILIFVIQIEKQLLIIVNVIYRKKKSIQNRQKISREKASNSRQFWQIISVGKIFIQQIPIKYKYQFD
eukprot:TRINITY_DN10751_c0_g1_i4.p2 TRINITY_DN10751_c0_g1~~TRINITY_DN10751_c0_g1_i4.p2  ORF type:complete len:197 (+),score=-4.56 TRINITY_DN10751_c0_g1_i4:160-750(+)